VNQQSHFNKRQCYAVNYFIIRHLLQASSNTSRQDAEAAKFSECCQGRSSLSSRSYLHMHACTLHTNRTQE